MTNREQFQALARNRQEARKENAAEETKERSRREAEVSRRKVDDEKLMAEAFQILCDTCDGEPIEETGNHLKVIHENDKIKIGFEFNDFDDQDIAGTVLLASVSCNSGVYSFFKAGVGGESIRTLGELKDKVMNFLADVDQKYLKERIADVSLGRRTLR